MMTRHSNRRSNRKATAHAARTLVEALERRAMFSVSFGPRVDYDLAPGKDPHGVVAGDFTGDGKIDLLTDNFWGGATVGILHGNGDGTFQPNPTQQPGIYGGTDMMTVADLN